MTETMLGMWLGWQQHEIHREFTWEASWKMPTWKSERKQESNVKVNCMEIDVYSKILQDVLKSRGLVYSCEYDQDDDKTYF